MNEPRKSEGRPTLMSLAVTGILDSMETILMCPDDDNARRTCLFHEILRFESGIYKVDNLDICNCFQRTLGTYF